MSLETAEHVPITTDSDGVMRVGGTRVTLDTVIGAFRDGATAEEISHQYPSLSLADIYAVIAYYLRRRAEVEVIHRGPSPATVVVVTVALLCGLGLVMVYSASSVTAVRTLGNSWGIVSKQAMWLVLGVGAAFAASRVPWRVWRDRVALPLMLVSVAALGYLALGVLAQKATGTSLPSLRRPNSSWPAPPGRASRPRKGRPRSAVCSGRDRSGRSNSTG